MNFSRGQWVELWFSNAVILCRISGFGSFGGIELENVFNPTDTYYIDDESMMDKSIVNPVPRLEHEIKNVKFYTN